MTPLKLTAVFIMSVIGVLAYVQYMTTTITMAGRKYEHAGMAMSKDVNGSDIYIPIYKRIE